MIKVKTPKYKGDTYCTCCRKQFDNTKQIFFSHNDNNDAVVIKLCGKCREELRKALEGETNG